jgi:hypothetical protein
MIWALESHRDVVTELDRDVLGMAVILLATTHAYRQEVHRVGTVP